MVDLTGQDLKKAMNNLPDRLARSIFCELSLDLFPFFKLM